MAVPSSSTLDRFNRDDEDPLSNDGKWSATPLYPDEGTFEVVNGAAVPTLASATEFSGSAWTETTFTNSEAFYQLANTPNGAGNDNYYGLWLRAQNIGTTSLTGYYLALDTSSGVYFIRISRWQDEQPTVLATVAPLTPAPAATHKFGFQAIGSHLRGFVDTGSGWTEVISAEDSTFSSGYLAIETNDPAAQFDNFGGGEVGAGSPWITTTELSEAMNGASVATARGTAVITAACDMVRLATEQEIYPVTAGSVNLDGTGTDCLLLPQLPVHSASPVIENVGSPAPGTLTLGTDYKLSDNGELYRLPGVIDSGWSTSELRTYWWPGRQNIAVTYSYGYSTVPGDLKEVAIQMAKRLHSSRDGSVVFEQLGQRSIRYAGPASEWTNTEKLVLSKYRQAR